MLQILLNICFDIIKDIAFMFVVLLSHCCICEMFSQAPAVNTMAVFLSHMRSPSPRVRSHCGHTRTRTVVWTTTAIPRQSPNCTTLLRWRAPQVTWNAVISASSPRTPLQQILTTQSRALRAAAAVAPPRSPAGEAKDKASTPKKTVYQTWRMWLWEAPGGPEALRQWMRRVGEGEVHAQCWMVGRKMK